MTMGYKHRKWTKKELEYVMRMRNEGMTWVDIATTFGCCVETIKNQLRKAGLR